MASKAFSFVTILSALVSVYAVPQAFSAQQSAFPAASTVRPEQSDEWVEHGAYWDDIVTYAESPPCLGCVERE